MDSLLKMTKESYAFVFRRIEWPFSSWDGALGAVVLQLNSIDLGQAGLFPRAKVQLNGHDGADVVAVRENWALDSPGEGDGLAVALGRHARARAAV